MTQSTMQISNAGDRALLITLPDASAARLRAAAKQLPEVTIIGQESLLVICDGVPDRERIVRAIESATEESSSPPRVHHIDVVFDGIDLGDLLARVPREEFLARVRDVRLSVRYLGFRAGFAYCEGWPREWQLPRRPTSRNRVEAGSFAIAGAMAGFYPVDSPGGWNILGRTNAVLWDPEREPPNWFAPGDEIELVSGGQTLLSVLPRTETRTDKSVCPPLCDVLSPGQLTTIVGARDWQRAYAGVSPGGPFDEHAAALANRAVGNEDDAPLLECVLVGPTLKMRERRRVAWCDPVGTVRELSGDEISIARFHGGLRGYLAIEGGIDERRARYAESPTVLRRGDVLQEGHRGARKIENAERTDRLTIRILRGPHDAPPLPETWDVTNQINRVGIRLQGRKDFIPPADLPSLGMQYGTLQWHPDGSVIAMGPDHPVTGGYLQPATVIAADRWKLGQVMPGERVRLQSCG
jgi:KipI family sensor histidine kinase inhibitor